MSTSAMSKHLEDPGFTPPSERALGHERRSATLAELVTTIGLFICTIIAVTAVSVGIARADAASTVIDNESGLFVIALLLGLAFMGLGGLTFIAMPHFHKTSRH